MLLIYFDQIYKNVIAKSLLSSESEIWCVKFIVMGQCNIKLGALCRHISQKIFLKLSLLVQHRNLRGDTKAANGMEPR